MKPHILLLMLCANVDAWSAQVVDVNRIANAIYHAEGGPKARPAYGIKSVRPRNTRHAREICIRTIKSAHADWDGKTDLIEHIGRKYCPPESDPTGHKNWVRNVKHFLK